MWDEYVLYAVFLGQILVLSFYFPNKILGLINKTIAQHPSSEYPKLYPVDVKVIQGKLKLFGLFNMLVVALGLAVLLFSIIYNSKELGVG
ncbi:hypothetical protein RS130_09380 [Paraglaciecola aquimarina]|uniref:Uncharacterized protein n=1 Tax=Paraglaciecola aquimarina TaxID=1235557 RepID=A0ABU3SVR9_9ALTE|nr:hypothetical protein [Paraglaciecola aquimarina]MDU0354118.1 hypothetical protein [Paraglaciecola aquimarina]